jgi:hypothetical protein
MCIAWLLNHFDVYGDKAPDPDTEEGEIKMSLNWGNEVFEQYQEELSRSGESLVQINRFYEIWSSLFPFAVNRP